MITDRLTLVLLLSLAFLSSKSCGRVLVNITNNLSTREDLGLHCKSKDDDLGVHVLRYNGSYDFSFRDNVFGRTLFFCAFWWPPQTSKVHWLDIYRADRDGCDTCLWFVDESGACLDDSPFLNCLKWNNDVF